jgi:hypothetical protein
LVSRIPHRWSAFLEGDKVEETRLPNHINIQNVNTDTNTDTNSRSMGGKW